MPPKRTLLFVDDQADALIDSVRRAFPSFDITAVANPTEAIEKFRFSEVNPDALLLDVNFTDVWGDVEDDFPDADPDLLGLEVLERFRSMDPSLPIAMLTAFERIGAAFGAGLGTADSFLVKNQVFADKDPTPAERQILSLIERRSPHYDKDQQQLAEEVADEYRDLETNKPGTVAYWHFEEQRLLEIARSLLASNTGKLRVLDVGTGDGRFPEVLCQAFPDRLEISAVDFSGKMLAASRERHTGLAGEIEYCRCTAEQLPFNDDEFDLVVAGFGFLSYCTKEQVLPELVRVGKQNADYLLGTYNYDALFHSVWGGREDNPDAPISGRISRDAGELRLPNGRTIRVYPFSDPEIRRVLVRAGLEIQAGWTFPTLYSTLPCSISKRLPSEAADATAYHGFEDFSPRLYEQDAVHSANNPGLGYYRLHHCRPTASSGN